MTHPSTAILDSQLNDGVLRLTKQNADENYGMSLAMLDALSRAFDDAREIYTFPGRRCRLAI